jgi:hypothetical protein
VAGEDGSGVPVGLGVPGQPAAAHQFDGQVEAAVPGVVAAFSVSRSECVAFGAGSWDAVDRNSIRRQ